MRVTLKTLATLVLALLLAACVWAPSPQEVPHSNIKLVVSSDSSAEETIAKAEGAILGLGYRKEENDWEKWQPILSVTELEYKKGERIYTKGQLQIMYMPEREGAYKLLPFLHVDFYENGRETFSAVGMEGYEQLRQKLQEAGIKLSEEDETDIKYLRPVTSPASFNQHHPPRSLGERLGSYMAGAFGMGVYALLVLWPAFWMGLRVLGKWPTATYVKRILLVVVGGVILAPFPMPLSMFGPFLFVPLPVVMPFVMGGQNVPMEWQAWSIAGTMIVAGLASTRVRRG